MIIVNKRTKEKVEVTYPEFRRKFAKELEDAFESYRKSVMAKPSYKINNAPDLAFDFYFDLQWNFNSHTNTNLYIERM